MLISLRSGFGFKTELGHLNSVYMSRSQRIKLAVHVTGCQSNRNLANGMSKRKPPVPRRRIGVHLVDFSTRHTSLPHAKLARIVSSATTTASDARSPGLEDAAAGAAPDDPISLPSSPDASLRSPTLSPTRSDKHAQQDKRNVAMAPHMQHVKSVVTTVPLIRSSPLRTDVPAEKPSPAPASNGSDTITMTVAELEAWKQRTVMQIEDHFTNEQLKRIAEFGRVHANLVKEAKEYVYGIETQLKEQFHRERESLQRQAEEYVAQFQQQNEELRQHVGALQEEIAQLKASTGTQSLSSDVEDEESAEAEEEVVVGEEESVSTTQYDETVEADPMLASPVADGSEEHEVLLEDVTETMSRSMGIQTPKVPTSKGGRVVRTAVTLDEAFADSPRATSSDIHVSPAVDHTQLQTVEAYL